MTKLKRAVALIAGLAIFISLSVSCNTTDTRGGGQDQDRFEVLGFYEFEFVQTDEGVMAFARETPPETWGLDSQALNQLPVGSLQITDTVEQGNRVQADNNPRPGNDAAYLSATFNVDNTSGQDLSNITFLGYNSSSTFEAEEDPGDPNNTNTVPLSQLEGSALSIASRRATAPLPTDSTFAVDARVVTPTHRVDQVAGDAPSGSNLTASNFIRADLSSSDFVAYSEGEIAGIANYFTTNFSFVNTVFPYGYVVRETSTASASRTIADGTSGVVRIAWRGPGETLVNGNTLDGLRRVKFHAVAITDSEVRVTQNVEGNYREDLDDSAANPPDGFRDTIQLAQAVDDGSIPGPINADKISIIGTMFGDSTNIGYTAERLGAGIPCSTFVPLPDVRIAGGGTTGFPTVNMIAYGNSVSSSTSPREGPGSITDISAGTPSLPAGCDQTTVSSFSITGPGGAALNGTYNSGDVVNLEITALDNSGIPVTTFNDATLANGAKALLTAQGFAITSGGGILAFSNGVATASVTIVSSGSFFSNFFVTSGIAVGSSTDFNIFP